MNFLAALNPRKLFSRRKSRAAESPSQQSQPQKGLPTMATKSITFLAHLIGKSEIRHEGGGFMLTFQIQTPNGLVEFRHQITQAEGDLFPLTEMRDKLDDKGEVILDAEKKPVQEAVYLNKAYKILIVDADSLVAGEGETAETLKAALADAQSELADAKEEAEITSLTIAEQRGEIDTYKAEVARLAEELDAEKTAHIATKEEAEAAKVSAAEAAASADASALGAAAGAGDLGGADTAGSGSGVPTPLADQSAPAGDVTSSSVSAGDTAKGS